MGVRRVSGLNCERIASPASRAPLRGSLRSALTGCLLTPTTRSADGPVKRWLRHLRPPPAGLPPIGRAARTAAGPAAWRVFPLYAAERDKPAPSRRAP